MTLHYCIQFLSRFLKLKYRGRSRNSNNLWSFMKDRNPHTEIYGCILYDLRTSVSNYYLENKHKLQILYGQLSSNTIYITTVIFCWRYSFTFVGFDRPTHRPKQPLFSYIGIKPNIGRKDSLLPLNEGNSSMCLCSNISFREHNSFRLNNLLRLPASTPKWRYCPPAISFICSRNL